MYSPRRRRYYSTKYYRNRLFAPSLSKANKPNYYQMKGRIIQQTPTKIKEPPTSLVTKQVLDKYYKILQNYKYPIPMPIPPSYDDMNFSFRTQVISYTNIPDTINLDYIFNNFVQPKIPDLPVIPPGYAYHFQLTSINFNYNLPLIEDTSNYSFTWNSNLTDNPIALIVKSVSSSIGTLFQGDIFCIPSSSNSMRAAQITFNQGSVNYRFTNFGTTDQVATDDVLYPLMTSLQNQETYNATIDVSKTGNSTGTTIRFQITIFLAPE